LVPLIHVFDIARGDSVFGIVRYVIVHTSNVVQIPSKIMVKEIIPREIVGPTLQGFHTLRDIWPQQI
jgi:hypothetical protein